MHLKYPFESLKILMLIVSVLTGIHVVPWKSQWNQRTGIHQVSLLWNAGLALLVSIVSPVKWS